MTKKNPKGLVRWLWNPFSRHGRELKLEAQAERLIAHALQERSERLQDQNEDIYVQQKKVAEELRMERRRNHFSDMFGTAIPIRNPSAE